MSEPPQNTQNEFDMTTYRALEALRVSTHTLSERFGEEDPIWAHIQNILQEIHEMKQIYARRDPALRRRDAR